MNSLYDATLGEVAAFEELVGSHGGLGGPQTAPFVLFPAEWPLDDVDLVGAPAVHRQLRRWLDRLRTDGVDTAAPAVAPAPAPLVEPAAFTPD